MPVLEKEVDFVLPAPTVQPTQPNIFPTTVTPPPTPPLSGSPDLDEIKRELKNMDDNVFESRLSPVEEGLKLKINRLVDNNEKIIKSVNVENKLIMAEHNVDSSIPGKDVKSSESTTNKVEENIKASDKPGVLDASKQQSHITERQDTNYRGLPCPQEKARADISHRAPSTGSITGAVPDGKEKQENLQLGGVSVVSTPYG